MMVAGYDRPGDMMDAGHLPGTIYAPLSLIIVMSWIEIIRLRTDPTREREVARVLLKLVKEVTGTPDLRHANLYRNMAIPSDISLHLSWSGRDQEPRESGVGLRVAETLKDFGLLDHSLWVEKK